MRVQRVICLVAAHEDRTVRRVGTRSTERWVLRCQRCGRRTTLPGSTAQGRYTWDLGPD